MKIIKYGHIKPIYAFCRGCGAILEFTKADTKISNIALSKGLQNEGKDFIVICPCCRRAIYDEQFEDSPENC